jgi:hypothetical protein
MITPPASASLPRHQQARPRLVTNPAPNRRQTWTNNDNQFFENRFREIKARNDAGDVDGSARLLAATVNESGFSGPDADARTYAALSAAAGRLRRR